MITVTATSGNQVEGLTIDDDLQVELFGNAADDVVVANSKLHVMNHMAIIIAFKKGWSFATADDYIKDHTTTIS